MIIIIDTNVLISALIRDSVTRKIIVYSGLNFYYPEISLHEIRKYKNLILKKSGLSEDDYENLLGKILEYVLLVPTEEIEEKLEEAKSIMLHIDPDDVVFIAAALSYPDSLIWSDDAHFEKQARIKVLKTYQFMKLFQKNHI